MSTDSLHRTALIANRRGLHARAAAKFVKLAATFNAQVTVGHRGTEVSGISIMGLMMLAAAPGCSIDISAQGADAQAALDALTDLVDRKFDED
ncbi:HPr family phosphocarrier protein [Magnetospirillum fulvum]|jgi:phosphocarrier protein|uniref:Phosphotransferase system, HPr-related protein n=1 Tax=Magnetospirillum fulvum MGU-K5 TaxID=1316936 RepID=S9S5J8_MAGFU|nr:HPr family phosphocarrier protein [Magnetospirillum fulvum]EPY01152.1 phosphotransferase system, HPr-related protein [Magnetospirillum fulvum MGU-K5]